jgi:hypothetical protein
MGIRALLPGTLVFSATTIVISFLHIDLFTFSETADLIWFGWFILATAILVYMTVRSMQVQTGEI